MIKKYLSLAALLILVVILPDRGYGQITVRKSQTATQLVNKLLGGGVSVSSPVLTCDSTKAEGIFAGLSVMSFDSGIVLTTGLADTTASSPFSYGAVGPAMNFASTSNGLGGDPLLTALAGQPTFDACILEFDFRPAGDTIKFNYVFGSEEYTDYTCSDFNDVFGFFVSGPGYASPTNIALVPGTSIPVCINSVNCGATGGWPISTCHALGAGSPFCSFYVNNSMGSTITYDGITTTLQAIAAVTPCETYHLKIGIADGTDHSFDSGVFLEAGSLSSTGISVSPVGMNSLDTSAGSQYCVRGCLPGQFVFSITTPQSTPFVIHFNIGGTAVNGFDYSAIADSVIIPAGSTTTTLWINPLPGAGGNRTVILDILSPYSCSGGPTILQSVIMNIYDNFFVHITNPDTTICEGQTVHVVAVADPSLVFSWTPAGTGGNTLTVDVSPSDSTTYVISAVFPGAGCPAAHDTLHVYVIHPFSISVFPSLQNTCVGVSLPLHLTVNTTSGGTYSPVWAPAANLTGANTNDPVFTPVMPGDVLFNVSDTELASHCFATTTFTVHVLPNDFSLLNPDTTMCFSGVVPIRLIGDTEFSYHWTPTTVFDNPNIATPTATVSTTTVLTVTASYPGCPDMVHTLTLAIEAPHVDITTRDTAFCIGDSVHLNVVATPPGEPFTLSWTPTTYLVDPSSLSPTFTSTTVGDFPYSVTITSPLGCTSTDYIILSPRPSAHIAITNASAMVVYGSQVQLNADNLTPYPLIYWWTPDNGSLDNPNINNPIATVYDSTTYIVYAMNEWGCRDSASVVLLIDDGASEFIPAAFTPNGDGLNDLFRISNIRYQKIILFEVYNRWGQRVYQNNNTNDAAKGWDGTFNSVPQDMGVYNYQIIVAKPDGKQKMYKGAVTLIR